MRLPSASWLPFSSVSVSTPSALGRVIAMLSLLKFALAASPLLVQQVGANPVPDLEMRQAGDQKGAVASESDICSRIGIALLEQGGNAADAVSWVGAGTSLLLTAIACWHNFLHWCGWHVPFWHWRWRLHDGPSLEWHLRADRLPRVGTRGSIRRHVYQSDRSQYLRRVGQVRKNAASQAEANKPQWCTWRSPWPPISP